VLMVRLRATPTVQSVVAPAPTEFGAQQSQALRAAAAADEQPSADAIVLASTGQAGGSTSSSRRRRGGPQLPDNSQQAITVADPMRTTPRTWRTQRTELGNGTSGINGTTTEPQNLQVALPTTGSTKPAEMKLSKEEAEDLLADIVTPHDVDTMKRRAKEARNECCNMCCFCNFLVIFTITMFLEQYAPSARLADHLRAKLAGGSVPISTVSSVSTLYHYLEHGLIPVVYADDMDTRLASGPKNTLLPLDMSNRILGTMRLRQLRVSQADACQVSPMFQTYTIRCYPSWDGGSNSKESFGLGSKFSYSEDSNGAHHTGAFAQYPPDGFMQLLPTNGSRAAQAVRTLQQDGFMDSATRVIFAEFNIWSSNVGSYALVTIIVEFGATSLVKQSIDVLTLSERSFVPGGLGFPADICGFIFGIILMLYVWWFAIEELQEIWLKRLGYFLDIWNLMDWFNMVLLLVAFVVRVWNYSSAGNANLGQEALVDQSSFSSLRLLAERAELVLLLNAVNAVMLWTKATKYLRHLPIVKGLVRDFWGAIDMFVPFLLIIGVIFVGFMLAFNVGFGDKIWQMASPYRTGVYLCRTFVNDATLKSVYDLQPLFGALMILLFYVILLLVATSFLFAIIVDALFQSKYNPKDTSSNFFFQDITDKILDRLPLLMRRLEDKVAKEQGSPSGSGDGKQAGSLAGLPELPPIDEGVKIPSRGEVLRAIELMSGRILSEISIVSIEIKSELHEVCERVDQMQMAAEELTLRTESIRKEQAANLT